MRACGPVRLIIARSTALSIHNPLVITIEPEDSPRRRRAVEEAAAHSLTPEFGMSIPKDDPRITEVQDREALHKKKIRVGVITWLICTTAQRFHKVRS